MSRPVTVSGDDCKSSVLWPSQFESVGIHQILQENIETFWYKFFLDKNLKFDILFPSSEEIERFKKWRHTMKWLLSCMNMKKRYHMDIIHQKKSEIGTSSMMRKSRIGRRILNTHSNLKSRLLVRLKTNWTNEDLGSHMNLSVLNMTK